MCDEPGCVCLVLWEADVGLVKEECCYNWVGVGVRVHTSKYPHTVDLSACAYIHTAREAGVKNQTLRYVYLHVCLYAACV